MEPDESELKARIEGGSTELFDYLSLINFYGENGEHSKALSLCDRALNLSLTSEERAFVISRKGEMLNLLGRRDEALACFEESSRLLSQALESVQVLNVKASNHYNLSLSHLVSEEQAQEYATQALNYFERLVGMDPNYEEKYLVYSRIADLYSRKNELDKALEIYDEALTAARSDDEKTWCVVGMANICANKDERAKAQEYYEQALKLGKQSASLSKIYFDIGKAYRAWGQVRNAADHFNQALRLRENDPVLRNDKFYVAEIYWNLGRLAYDEQENDKTISYMTKVLENIDETYAYYCDAQLTLGHCFSANGQKAKARKHYNAVLFAPHVIEDEKKMADKCLKKIGGEGTA